MATTGVLFVLAVVLSKHGITAGYASENTTGWQTQGFTEESHLSSPTTVRGGDDVREQPPSPDVWHYLGYVSVPALLVVGVCGNTMTIIVMRDSQFKSNPFSYILIALALSDTTLNILSPLTRQFVREMVGRDIRATNTVTCVTFFWFWRMSKMTSSWLVVAISVERLIAIVYPLHASRLITKRAVLVTITAIYLFLGIYNAFWGTVVDRVINGACIPNTRPLEARVLSLVLILIGCCLYSFLPSLLLIINTGRTIIGLKEAKAQATQIRSEVNNAYDKITRMLLAVSGAFVILVLPITIGHLLAIVDEISILEDTNVAITVLREVAQLAEQINYSINFFLYATCSSLFRQRFFEIVTCGQSSGKTSHKKPQEASNSSATTHTRAWHGGILLKILDRLLKLV